MRKSTKKKLKGESLKQKGKRKMHIKTFYLSAFTPRNDLLP